MIRGDGVQSAVLQTFDEGQTVLLCAQGRVHAVVGVLGFQGLVREQQVVGAGLRGDLYPPGLGVPDEGHRALGAHVADVDGRADGGRRGDFPGGAAVLGGGGDAGHPQLAGDLPLVHQAAGSQVQILAVGGDSQPQRGRLLQGLQQAAGVYHRPAVVAEGDGPRLLQSGKVRQLLPLQVLGDAGGGVHSGVGGLGPLQQRPDGFGGIHGGLGVGHGQQAGDAPRGRRPAAGVHVLLVGKARVPEMDVHIHQAGRRHQASAVDHLGVLGRQAFAQLGNLPILQQQVHHLVQPLGGVNDPSVLNQRAHSGTPFFNPAAGAPPAIWSGRAILFRNIPGTAGGPSLPPSCKG